MPKNTESALFRDLMLHAIVQYLVGLSSRSSEKQETIVPERHRAPECQALSYRTQGRLPQVATRNPKKTLMFRCSGEIFSDSARKRLNISYLSLHPSASPRPKLCSLAAMHRHDVWQQCLKRIGPLRHLGTDFTGRLFSLTPPSRGVLGIVKIICQIKTSMLV